MGVWGMVTEVGMNSPGAEAPGDLLHGAEPRRDRLPESRIWRGPCNADGMPRRRSIRLKAFDYVGEYRCFFTLSTRRRPDRFTSREVVDAVLSQFLQCAESEDIAIAAHCFMP